MRLREFLEVKDGLKSKLREAVGGTEDLKEIIIDAATSTKPANYINKIFKAGYAPEDDEESYVAGEARLYEFDGIDEILLGFCEGAELSDFAYLVHDAVVDQIGDIGEFYSIDDFQAEDGVYDFYFAALPTEDLNYESYAKDVIAVNRTKNMLIVGQEAYELFINAINFFVKNSGLDNIEDVADLFIRDYLDYDYEGNETYESLNEAVEETEDLKDIMREVFEGQHSIDYYGKIMDAPYDTGDEYSYGAGEGEVWPDFEHLCDRIMSVIGGHNLEDLGELVFDAAIDVTSEIPGQFNEIWGLPTAPDCFFRFASLPDPYINYEDYAKQMFVGDFKNNRVSVGDEARKMFIDAVNKFAEESGAKTIEEAAKKFMVGFVLDSEDKNRYAYADDGEEIWDRYHYPDKFKEVDENKDLAQLMRLAAHYPKKADYINELLAAGYKLDSVEGYEPGEAKMGDLKDLSDPLLKASRASNYGSKKYRYGTLQSDFAALCDGVIEQEASEKGLGTYYLISGLTGKDGSNYDFYVAELPSQPADFKWSASGVIAVNHTKDQLIVGNKARNLFWEALEVFAEESELDTIEAVTKLFVQVYIEDDGNSHEDLGEFEGEFDN